MPSPDEAAMNRCFVDAAQSVTVIADSSKFSSQAIFRICEKACQLRYHGFGCP